MSSVSASQELDTRLAMALDPFEDMCGPKSQGSIPSWKVLCKLALHVVRYAATKALVQSFRDLVCEQSETRSTSQRNKTLQLQMCNWTKQTRGRLPAGHPKAVQKPSKKGSDAPHSLVTSRF